MATSAYRHRCIEAKGRECHHCGDSRNLEVHHLDGDRNNNTLDNLLPLCRQCHRKLHRVGLNGIEELLKPVEERSHIDPTKTTFGVQYDRDKWQQWKLTVPRNKSLEKRIIELIEADTQGRVMDAKLDLVELTDRLERAIEHGSIEDIQAIHDELEGAIDT